MISTVDKTILPVHLHANVRENRLRNQIVYYCNWAECAVGSTQVDINAPSKGVSFRLLYP